MELTLPPIEVIVKHAVDPLPVLQVKRLHLSAKVPTRGSNQAIGLDLYATSNPEPDQRRGEFLERGKRSYNFAPGERKRISTGIAVAIPPGYYGRVAPRSGLAHKWGIDVLAGCIDADYRGEVHVILLNTGPHHFTVHAGDRVAQLILERADMLPVVEVTELDDTQRGDKGYGSSGT